MTVLCTDTKTHNQKKYGQSIVLAVNAILTIKLKLIWKAAFNSNHSGHQAISPFVAAGDLKMSNFALLTINAEIKELRRRIVNLTEAYSQLKGKDSSHAQQHLCLIEAHKAAIEAYQKSLPSREDV